MSNIPSYTSRDFASHLRDQTSIDFPDLQTIIDWIKLNLSPEDVFSENDLENWAEHNGFKKPDDE